MKYKDGTESKEGDVIRWYCYDSDDYHTWTLTGIVKRDGVMYLGGGIDFGAGVGQIFSFNDVISESEDNDTYQRGVEKVGVVSALAKHILGFRGDV